LTIPVAHIRNEQSLLTQHPIPYWRLATWYFFYFAFIGAFTPYFGVYLQSLGVSAWRISLLVSLMQLMRLLAPYFWSWLAEHGGRKTHVVRVASALSMIGFAGFFLTQDFAGLFASMILLAFFWSASLPLVEALTLGHLRQHAERYGSIRLWGSIGFIAAVMAIGAMLDALPITSLLWVTLVLLGGIFISAMALPEAATEAAPPTPSAPLGQTLRQRNIMVLLAANFLMAAAHGPLYVFYSIHLVDHGYAKTLVGGLWSLGVVAEILVFLFMPRLLRRHSLRAILLFSFACAVLRFLMIGWGVEYIVMLLAAQLLHGATFGACHAATIAALHQWFPARQQGHAQALYGSIAFGAGGMLGGLLGGQTWDSAGSAWTFTIAAAFALAGLLLVWRGIHPAHIAPTAPAMQ
jgi:PPP family 3-phenylpropionic acid transporter